jgi:tRNA pseudouridine13 synthase
MGMKIINGKLVKSEDSTSGTASSAGGSGSGSAAAAASSSSRAGGGRGGPPARPGDWTCPSCGANVFASKSSCFKCRAPKPGGGNGGGSSGGGSSAGAGRPGGGGASLYRGSSGTTEADVGITHYLNTEGSWDCIVKHRYADFVVQEIDEKGQVCTLGDLAAPPEPKEEVEAGYADGGAAAAGGDAPAPAAPTTDDGFTYLAAEDILPAADIEKIRTLTSSFGTGANAAPGVDTMDGLDYVILSPCDDKDKRRRTHEAVRKYFGGFESDVAEDANGAKCIRIRRAGRAGKGGKRKGGDRGGDRKAKRQAFDPRGPAKTGWPAGKPKFCEFTLCKEGKDTQDAIDIVGRLLRRNTNAFSYAGSKDKRGVTTQRVSAFQTRASDLAKLNERLMGVRVGSFAYKEDKLELGALQGNHFIVTLRRVLADAATIERAVTSVRESGFINYFGLQRFGTGAVPTHAIGRAMLRGEYQAAVGLIMHPREGEVR